MVFKPFRPPLLRKPPPKQSPPSSTTSLATEDQRDRDELAPPSKKQRVPDGNHDATARRQVHTEYRKPLHQVVRNNSASNSTISVNNTADSNDEHTSPQRSKDNDSTNKNDKYYSALWYALYKHSLERHEKS